MNQYGTFNQSYPTSSGVNGGQDNEPSFVFDIEDKQSFEHILQMFPIVIVDVWAPYCNPCRMMAAKYNDVAKQFVAQHKEQKIIFMKDNIEQHDDIHKPHVTVVPTFFMYVHGKRYHIPDFREMQVTIETALVDNGLSQPVRSPY